VRGGIEEDYVEEREVIIEAIVTPFAWRQALLNAVPPPWWRGIKGEGMRTNLCRHNKSETLITIS
jgi:hypothetical protein